MSGNIVSGYGGAEPVSEGPTSGLTWRVISPTECASVPVLEPGQMDGQMPVPGLHADEKGISPISTSGVEMTDSAVGK